MVGDTATHHGSTPGGQQTVDDAGGAGTVMTGVGSVGVSGVGKVDICEVIVAIMTAVIELLAVSFTLEVAVGSDIVSEVAILEIDSELRKD